MNAVVIIGYGGHGYVAADILLQSGYKIAGYCDTVKQLNPFNLKWLGTEQSFFSHPDNCASHAVFISIGDNVKRQKVFTWIQTKNVNIISAIHPRATVADKNILGKGVFIAANAAINPCCMIGDGAICNTSCSIDHECVVGNFTHICPGSVLCGNVTVGSNSFIGAKSVVTPRVVIGSNVTLGAGSTVVKNLLKAGVYAGTPAQLLNVPEQ